MDLADVHALRSPAGRALLASLPAYEDGAALALGERLRREHPPELVSAAMTQAWLRARARPRLGEDADRLLLTPDGLEQATRAVVARRHAGRFAEAGVRRVADLCCGIGVDLLALARAGLRVTGVDRDPVTCAVAEANVAALGLTACADVTCADVKEVDLHPYDGVFCDPARRAAGRRTRSPQSWSPPWTFVEQLLGQALAVGVKVAPGIPHALVPAAVEAEWVSVGGVVVEAALWSGALASDGVGRRATLLPAGATLAGTGAEPVAVGGLGRYLYEPDGAVIRAGLVAAVAALADGRLLDPTIAYLSSDALVPTPFATAYEVHHAMPFQLKRLRAQLRARDVGHVVVKKRGSALEPEQLRRRLRLDGPGRATVVLTRLAGAPWALLVDPVPLPRSG